MASTQTTDSKSVEVPRQDQPAEGGNTDTPADDLIYGIPKAEYEAMDYPAQKRVEMLDLGSKLRNQETPEDTADFQLLSSTNAYTIEALTGMNLNQLAERAKKLNVTLKGSLAGDTKPVPAPTGSL